MNREDESREEARIQGEEGGKTKEKGEKDKGLREQMYERTEKRRGNYKECGRS